MAEPDQGLVHATELALGLAAVVFLSLSVATGFVLWNAGTMTYNSPLPCTAVLIDHPVLDRDF